MKYSKKMAYLKGTRAELALLLVGLGLFSILFVTLWGVKQAPNLLPVWGVALYVWARGRATLGNKTCWGLLAITLSLSLGMVIGPLQAYGWANHLSHLLAAFILGAVAMSELRINNPLWLAGLAAMGVTTVCGVGMEISEALVHWSSTSMQGWQERYHDTIWDLTADLVGGALGIIGIAVQPSSE